MNTLIKSIFCLGFAFTLIVIAPAHSQDSLEPVMHEVFTDIAWLLRSNLGSAGTEPGENSEEVQQRLASLADSARMIEQHAQNRPSSFGLISRSFEDSVSRLVSYYDASQPEYSIYYLLDITRNCVACHSRLPDGTSYPLGEELLDSVNLDALNPTEVAQLEVAVRQFDQARITWESLFTDRELDPVYFDFEDAIIDYLMLNLRVFRDVARPARTLNQLLTRDDVPYYLQRHFNLWIAHLSELRGWVEGEPVLAEVRDLYRRSNELTNIPVSRDRVVYDVVISSLLNRLVESDAELTAGELSELWYMLGVIELRLARRSVSLPEAELYFESAIREAPETDTARRAYALLEEYTIYSLDQFIGGLNEGPVPLRELGELIGVDGGDE
jgi:tetratricopeptide (TPR) repeat protein